MDPDLVRLILIILGVVLVVAIYLWDRYKRAAPRRRPHRRAVGQNSAEPAATGGQPEPHTEVPVREADDDARDWHVGAPDAETGTVEPVPALHSALDPEPADFGDWSETVRDEAPQFAMDLRFDAHGDADYLNADPALYDEIERKIVVINVVARSGDFPGAAIDSACRSVGLVLGDMSIFHRHETPGGRVLFSMASMVEPGSFPVDDISGFATPGLSLFTQLPGARDGIEIYEEMLATAGRLASILNGELQDERHNKLTRQMQEHTRESIIEHRRRIRLTRSRH